MPSQLFETHGLETSFLKSNFWVFAKFIVVMPLITNHESNSVSDEDDQDDER